MLWIENLSPQSQYLTAPKSQASGTPIATHKKADLEVGLKRTDQSFTGLLKPYIPQQHADPHPMHSSLPRGGMAFLPLHRAGKQCIHAHFQAGRPICLIAKFWRTCNACGMAHLASLLVQGFASTASRSCDCRCFCWKASSATATGGVASVAAAGAAPAADDLAPQILHQPHWP